MDIISYYIEKTTQLLNDNDRYKQALGEIESYCKKCNLKADFTACDILQIINKLRIVNYE